MTNSCPRLALLSLLVVGMTTQLQAQNTRQYANPLALESIPFVKPDAGRGHRSVADPQILRYKGKYYLAATGDRETKGLFWISDDLVHWTYKEPAIPDGSNFVAPHVLETGGYFYLTGNDTGLYRSQDIMGPYVKYGDFTRPAGTAYKAFDPALFKDTDGRIYLYFSGAREKGIYGVELDRKDLRKMLTDTVHLFHFEPAHRWENQGASNQYTNLTWMEAPFMTKHNGTYYLQYSASGTDWKTYAVGVYTSKSPLGPFTYDETSPILKNQGGLIYGTGHNCIIDAPDGSLWCVYTLLINNWSNFERRLGMDPVAFENGHMRIEGPTETPQFAPGTAKNERSNGTGSLPLSIDQTKVTVSSQKPGRGPEYAIDNYLRTWWEAEDQDATPQLTIDLRALGGIERARFEKQYLIVDAFRILFGEGGFTRGRVPAESAGYQYRIETSMDGKAFDTVVDKSKNTADKAIEFDVIKPTKTYFVRLTILKKPKNTPLTILEFTAFGKAVIPPPAYMHLEAIRVGNGLHPKRQLYHVIRAQAK